MKWNLPMELENKCLLMLLNSSVIEQFDVELKQTEFGPKLQGTKEELEKAQDYIVKVMKERLDELNRR